MCVDEKYDYGEVLELSLLFYEAQRSGKLPDDNRIPWRGDLSLNDTGTNGEDLSGGYHDGECCITSNYVIRFSKITQTTHIFTQLLVFLHL